MDIDGRTDRIAKDMERVFRPIAGRRATSDSVVGQPRYRRRASGPLLLVIAAVIVAAVLAIGYRLGHVPPATVAATPGPGAATGVAKPMPGVIAPPAVVPAQTGDEIVQGPEAPSQAVAPVVVVQPPAASVDDRPSRQRRPAERSLSTTGVGVDRRDGITDCRPGSLEDRCIYQDVLNADARLARAYDLARRAGVSSDRLVAINDRWARARRDENPDRMIRRYEELTDVLDAERREVER